MKRTISVQITVSASLERVWECWNHPNHIKGWAVDSDDWEIREAENDLRVGGGFRIETVRTGSDSDGVVFVGTYTNIKEPELIEYDTADGQHVVVEFEKTGTNPDGVRITETFEPESETIEEDQGISWQATLENFRAYVEKR